MIERCCSATACSKIEPWPSRHPYSPMYLAPCRVNVSQWRPFCSWISSLAHAPVRSLLHSLSRAILALVVRGPCSLDITIPYGHFVNRPTFRHFRSTGLEFVFITLSTPQYLFFILYAHNWAWTNEIDRENVEISFFGDSAGLSQSHTCCHLLPGISDKPWQFVTFVTAEL